MFLHHHFADLIGGRFFPDFLGKVRAKVVDHYLLPGRMMKCPPNQTRVEAALLHRPLFHEQRLHIRFQMSGTLLPLGNVAVELVDLLQLLLGNLDVAHSSSLLSVRSCGDSSSCIEPALRYSVQPYSKSKRQRFESDRRSRSEAF